MKNYLLALFLLVPSMAMATGVYYNPDANGEGIVLMEKDNFYVTYFYTYGGEDCITYQDTATVEVTATVAVTAEVTATATAECPLDEDEVPLCDPVTVTETNSNTETGSNTETFSYPIYSQVCTPDGQRWFLMADPFKKDKGWITGTIYMTQGLNYPEGMISGDPNNPFGYDIAEVIPVGTYFLQPISTGYQLRVLQLEEDKVLADDDYLFTTPFRFNTLLFAPGTGD